MIFLRVEYNAHFTSTQNLLCWVIKKDCAMGQLQGDTECVRYMTFTLH